MIADILKDYFPTNFPSAGPQPYLISSAIVFFCLLVFSYPILSRLFAVPPNEILRKSEFEKLPIFKILLNALLGLIFFYSLLVFFTQNALLTNIIFFSMLGLVLFIFGLVFFDILSAASCMIFSWIDLLLACNSCMNNSIIV